jgi:hypothetical protein
MRTWLREKYPKGLGIGDLVHELIEVNKSGVSTHEELAQRKAELILALNCMKFYAHTPIFSDEFGKDIKY